MRTPPRLRLLRSVAAVAALAVSGAPAAHAQAPERVLVKAVVADRGAVRTVSEALVDETTLRVRVTSTSSAHAYTFDAARQLVTIEVDGRVAATVSMPFRRGHGPWTVTFLSTGTYSVRDLRTSPEIYGHPELRALAASIAPDLRAFAGLRAHGHPLVFAELAGALAAGGATRGPGEVGRDTTVLIVPGEQGIIISPYFYCALLALHHLQGCLDAGGYDSDCMEDSYGIFDECLG